MSNVLIRDVAPEDLELIKQAAAERGTSLQAYLWETVHAQAAFLRRREALAGAAARLEGGPAVSDEARTAVLEAVDAATDARAEALATNRPR